MDGSTKKCSNKLQTNQGEHTLFTNTWLQGESQHYYYVDGIVAWIEWNLKKELLQEFAVNKLIKLKYSSLSWIFILKQKYIMGLLKEMGKLWRNPIKSPIKFNYKLRATSYDTTIKKTSYQRLVGRLTYLVHMTVICVMNQFKNKPKNYIIECLIKILYYLKETMDNAATKLNWTMREFITIFELGSRLSQAFATVFEVG